MVGYHLVRVGAMGLVGNFQAADGGAYPRGARVVCRTRRGLEVGEILAARPTSLGHPGAGSSDGTLLRRMTTEDHLLAARLEKDRQRAVQACARLLAQRSIPAVLLDAEPLFDGQSLYFYFLGEVPPELDLLTAELAETYASRVQLRKFTETLLQGCGPGCGTDQAPGGGCGSSCGSCATAGMCGVPSRSARPI
jgi:hypothetical protein